MLRERPRELGPMAWIKLVVFAMASPCVATDLPAAVCKDIVVSSFSEFFQFFARDFNNW